MQDNGRWWSDDLWLLNVYYISPSTKTMLLFQPCPRGSDRLLKNLHLDLDALGGGLQYEVQTIWLHFSKQKCKQLLICWFCELRKCFLVLFPEGKYWSGHVFLMKWFIRFCVCTHSRTVRPVVEHQLRRGQSQSCRTWLYLETTALSHRPSR